MNRNSTTQQKRNIVGNTNGAEKPKHEKVIVRESIRKEEHAKNTRWNVKEEKQMTKGGS